MKKKGKSGLMKNLAVHSLVNIFYITRRDLSVAACTPVKWLAKIIVLSMVAPVI